MIERNGEVVCPFYRRDDGSQRIVCEGFTEGSSLMQYYNRKADFRQQLELFCTDRCSCCEVYRMLLAAKYE